MKIFILLFGLVFINHLHSQERPDGVPAHMYFRKESCIMIYNSILIEKIASHGEIQLLVVYPGNQNSNYIYTAVVKFIENGVVYYRKTSGNEKSVKLDWKIINGKDFNDFFGKLTKFGETAINSPSPQNSLLDKAGEISEECYVFCGPPWFFTVFRLYNPIKNTKCGEMWNEIKVLSGQ